MKKLITESLKAFTLVGCVFVMFSCGGDTCSTCVSDTAGVDNVEICDEGGVGSGVLYDAAVLSQELLGFTCTE